MGREGGRVADCRCTCGWVCGSAVSTRDPVALHYNHETPLKAVLTDWICLKIIERIHLRMVMKNKLT